MYHWFVLKNKSVLCSDSPIFQGFGVTARSTADTRKLDPTAIIVFHQAYVLAFISCFSDAYVTNIAMWENIYETRYVDLSFGHGWGLTKSLGNAVLTL